MILMMIMMMIDNYKETSARLCEQLSRSGVRTNASTYAMYV